MTSVIHTFNQSSLPKCSVNVVKTYLEQNDDRGSLSHSEPHPGHPISFSLTEESIQDIPIVLESQPFQSIQVITDTSVGENPVSVMAQEVVPEKRRRGRPPGSKNKPKPDTSSVIITTKKSGQSM